MPTSRQLRTLALLACIVAAETPSLASAEDETATNTAAARRHYDRARAYYEQGAYREAIAEFEAAHALDPNAKDLVFNLAVVHEKLADVDDALRWFRLYATMDLTHDEQERADAYLRRLEGAKRELEQKQAAQAAPPPAPLPPPAVKPQPEPPAGRVDAATVTAAALAGAALVFGVVMAVKAEQDEPESNFVTGRDGSYADLVNRTALAHREAILADVGFGVSIVGAAAAAYHFLARPRLVHGVVTGGAKISAGPLPGGGTLRLEGAF
jgi:tetratricopeptide (TPR) repeat protein